MSAAAGLSRDDLDRMWPGEEWRPVVGWERLYEVSSLGLIRSLDRIVPHHRGGTRLIRGQIQKGKLTTRGERYVGLAGDHRDRLTVMAARLVHEAFIGPVPDDTRIAYRDEDRANTSASNLYLDHGEQRSRFRFAEYWQEDPSTGCWIWIGAKRHDLKTERGGLYYCGKVHRAYCVSWMLHKGPIPDGLLVCHHCDNPRCVNPDHLFLGTYKDNAEDCVAKGRFVTARFMESRVRGTRHRSAKLNPDSVREIRERAAAGEADERLARIYGVAPSAIYAVVRRKSWKHVP